MPKTPYKIRFQSRDKRVPSPQIRCILFYLAYTNLVLPDDEKALARHQMIAQSYTDGNDSRNLKNNVLRGAKEGKTLKQKTKDQLTVLGILSLESVFIFGLITNFYRYIVLKIPLDLFLAVLSTIGAAFLLILIGVCRI